MKRDTNRERGKVRWNKRRSGGGAVESSFSDYYWFGIHQNKNLHRIFAGLLAGKGQAKMSFGFKNVLSSPATHLHAGLLKEPQPTCDSAEHHRCKCLAAAGGGGGGRHFLVGPQPSRGDSTDWRSKREQADLKRFHC